MDDYIATREKSWSANAFNCHLVCMVKEVVVSRVWTDSPLDRAQKESYLEAYNKTKAIAEGVDLKSKNSDASIVDKYNTSKRSVSLVQKHQESKEKKEAKAKPERRMLGKPPMKAMGP